MAADQHNQHNDDFNKSTEAYDDLMIAISTELNEISSTLEQISIEPKPYAQAFNNLTTFNCLIKKCETLKITLREFKDVGKRLESASAVLGCSDTPRGQAIQRSLKDLPANYAIISVISVNKRQKLSDRIVKNIREDVRKEISLYSSSQISLVKDTFKKQYENHCSSRSETKNVHLSHQQAADICEEFSDLGNLAQDLESLGKAYKDQDELWEVVNKDLDRLHEHIYKLEFWYAYCQQALNCGIEDQSVLIARLHSIHEQKNEKLTHLEMMEAIGATLLVRPGCSNKDELSKLLKVNRDKWFETEEMVLKMIVPLLEKEMCVCSKLCDDWDKQMMATEAPSTDVRAVTQQYKDFQKSFEQFKTRLDSPRSFLEENFEMVDSLTKEKKIPVQTQWNSLQERMTTLLKRGDNRLETLLKAKKFAEEVAQQLAIDEAKHLAKEKAKRLEKERNRQKQEEMRLAEEKALELQAEQEKLAELAYARYQTIMMDEESTCEVLPLVEAAETTPQVLPLMTLEDTKYSQYLVEPDFDIKPDIDIDIKPCLDIKPDLDIDRKPCLDIKPCVDVKPDLDCIDIKPDINAYPDFNIDIKPSIDIKLEESEDAQSDISHTTRNSATDDGSDISDISGETTCTKSSDNVYGPSLRITPHGVWSEAFLPEGTVFGPFPADAADQDSTGLEHGACWTTLVRTAVMRDQCNLEILRKGDIMYYAVVVNTIPGTELVKPYINWKDLILKVELVEADDSDINSDVLARCKRGEIKEVGACPRSLQRLRRLGDAGDSGGSLQLCGDLQEVVGSRRRSLRLCRDLRDFVVNRRSLRHAPHHILKQTYSCSICGMKFPNPRRLYCHFATHKKTNNEHGSSSNAFQCKECGRAFPTNTRLRIHKLVHRNNPLSKRSLTINQQGGTNTCDECGKSFASVYSLELHHKVHTGERPFRCSVCHICFRQKIHVLSHQVNNHAGQGFTETHDSRHEITECHLCKKYVRQIDLKAHLRIHAGQRPSAAQEPVKSDSSVNVETSKNFDGHRTRLRPYLCLQCPRAYSYHSGLYQHIKADHKDVYKKGKGQKISITEESRTTGKSQLNNKLKSNRCSECSEAFETYFELYWHKQTHAINCHICRKTFNGMDAWKKHMTTHSGSSVKKEKDSIEFQCKECEQSFSTPTGLRIHRLKHRNIPLTKKSQTSGQQGENVCHQCGKSFQNLANLELHFRIHTGERPYRCSECLACFRQHPHVKYHQKNYHAGKGVCLAHDSTDENSKCEDCGNYVRNADLEIHRRLHARQSQSNSQRDSSTKADTSQNVDKRDYTGLRAHACPQCPKVYSYRSAMLQHMEIHGKRTSIKKETGLNEFLCTECQQSFPTLNGLRIHRLVHRNIPLTKKSQTSGHQGGNVCHRCGKIFQNPTHLELHFRIHMGERPYRCSVCLVCFRQDVHVTNHLWKCHAGEGVCLANDTTDKNSKCEDCGKFVRNADLEIHRRIHAGQSQSNSQNYASNKADISQNVDRDDSEFQCTECQQSFSTLTGLRIHRLKHRNIPLTKKNKTSGQQRGHVCHRCGKSFKQPSLLEIHFRVHTGDRPYRCSECLLCFKRNAHVTRHQRNCHAGEGVCLANDTTDDISKCEDCGKFVCNADMEIHRRLHAGQSQSNSQEPEKDSSTIDADTSLTTDEHHTGMQSYTCLQCPAVYSYPSGLYQHIEKQHKDYVYKKRNQKNSTTNVSQDYVYKKRNQKNSTTNVSQTTGYQCPECGESFQTYGRLRTHRLVHLNVPNKSGAIRQRGKGRYMCYRCGRGCRDLHDLEKHFRSHTGERPFRCSVCKLCSMYRGSITVHQRRSHAGKGFCEANHPTDEISKCAHCHKYFRRDDMDVHLQIHNGPDKDASTSINFGVKPFSCTVCGSRFTKKSFLDRHMRMKHAHSRVKRYPCTLCDNSYTQKHNLDFHMKKQHVKIGEVKPFSCTLCGNSYTAKHNLNIHMKNKHAQVGLQACTKKFSKKYALQRMMHRKTGFTGKFQCKECGSSFPTLTRLQIHKLVHKNRNQAINLQENIKTECLQCGKCFRDSTSLRIHRRTHTGEKPFQCSVCLRCYRQKSHVNSHLMRIHAGKGVCLANHSTNQAKISKGRRNKKSTVDAPNTTDRKLYLNPVVGLKRLDEEPVVFLDRIVTPIKTVDKIVTPTKQVDGQNSYKMPAVVLDKIMTPPKKIDGESSYLMPSVVLDNIVTPTKKVDDHNSYKMPAMVLDKIMTPPKDIYGGSSYLMPVLDKIVAQTESVDDANSNLMPNLVLDKIVTPTKEVDVQNLHLNSAAVLEKIMTPTKEIDGRNSHLMPSLVLDKIVTPTKEVDGKNLHLNSAVVPEKIVTPTKTVDDKNSYLMPNVVLEKILTATEDVEDEISDLMSAVVIGEILTPTKKNIDDKLVQHSTCHICGKQLANEFSRDRHMKIHAVSGKDIQRITCPTCGKRFSNVQNRNRHMEIHALSRKHIQRIACPTCGKQFFNAFNRDRHMKNHTLSGKQIKDRACPTCGKQFSNAFNRYQHMQLHAKRKITKSGAAIFECRYCKFSSRFKNSTLRHEKSCKFSPGKSKKPSSSVTSRQPSKPTKRLKCIDCSRKFSTVKELKTHRKVHKGEFRPYKCTVCEKNCKQLSHLKEHMATHKAK